MKSFVNSIDTGVFFGYNFECREYVIKRYPVKGECPFGTPQASP